MKQSNEQLKSPIETRLELPLHFMLGEGQCTQIMTFLSLWTWYCGRQVFLIHELVIELELVICLEEGSNLGHPKPLQFGPWSAEATFSLFQISVSHLAFVQPKSYKSEERLVESTENYSRYISVKPPRCTWHHPEIPSWIMNHNIISYTI